MKGSQQHTMHVDSSVACGLLVFLLPTSAAHLFLGALQEHNTPIMSGMTGGLMIGTIGMLLPPVMFWGEQRTL